MTSTVCELTRRDLAILRAVAAGTAEMVCGCEPDLLIDGRCCCDQFAAHRLARIGLIAPARPGPPGQRTPALLTASGQVALADANTGSTEVRVFAHAVEQRKALSA